MNYCRTHTDETDCGCNAKAPATKPEPDSWEVITDLLVRFRIVFLIAAGCFAALALYQLARWATWPRLIYALS